MARFLGCVHRASQEAGAGLGAPLVLPLSALNRDLSRLYSGPPGRYPGRPDGLGSCSHGAYNLLGKPDAKQNSDPNYQVMSPVSSTWGVCRVVSGNQDSCPHLPPKVATSPFHLSVYAIVSSIPLSATAHLPSARPVKSGMFSKAQTLAAVRASHSSP